LKPETYTFFENVYDVVRLIPYGRVTNYGAIAAYLGSVRSSRMVGYAMNSAHSLIPPIAAHRVVNKTGLLTGKHHFGENRMQELLESEGIKVENNQVVDFEKHFWDPMKELSI
jgi:methylated-DNA-protein-cysteine methyltransferase-like protein